MQRFWILRWGQVGTAVGGLALLYFALNCGPARSGAGPVGQGGQGGRPIGDGSVVGGDARTGGAPGSGGSSSDAGAFDVGADRSDAVTSSDTGDEDRLSPVRIRGGDPNIAFVDLTFQGERLEFLEGVVASIRAGELPAQRLGSAQVRIVGGRFLVTLPQVLEPNKNKSRMIHFDTDRDGRCGAGDQIWKQGGVIGNPNEPWVIVVGPDQPTSTFSLVAPDATFCRRFEICGPDDVSDDRMRAFVDLRVSATGFGAHEGKRVMLATRTPSGALLGFGRAVVKGDGFSVYLPNGYERGAQQAIVWFVDVDGDGVCTTGGGDHTGFAMANSLAPGDEGPVTVDITDNHVDSSPGDPCAGIPSLLTMQIKGTGFDAHEKAPVRIATRNGMNGAMLGAGATTVQAGTFVLPQWPNAYERNARQEVDWFIDVDDDGLCDTARGDHVGTLITEPFNPMGNDVFQVSVSDNHMDKNPRNEDICAILNGCR